MKESPEAKIIAAQEAEAYKRVAWVERKANMWSLILASVCFGVGVGSFWIGFGVFFALLFIATTIANDMTKHRYLVQQNRRVPSPAAEEGVRHAD